MNIKRLITLALGGALLAAPGYVSARQNQESVADAARKAQAAKKNAPKAKLTIDDDNLNTITGTVSVVGEAPAPPQKGDAAADKSAKREAAAEKAEAKDEAYWRERFAAAYKKLSDDSRDLDLSQREFNLKQQQFYTDPMASLKQEYSRQDLNDAKTRIDQLAAKVDEDKADIGNLQDELRQAGGDPGWAAPPAPPAGGSAPAQ
jgi:chromosome segregation ATPase